MSDQTCMRCGEQVESGREDYEVFERMHWDCFHYAYEHDLNGEVAESEDCGQPGCPSGEPG
ncbi:hypothetical protein [Kribbella sp. NBC_00359]|uniref:hypothetical protein n=1 Tax=Kribbella sp. NBC_00359 TaxID=2975966 RepID=UPI002E21A818